VADLAHHHILPRRPVGLGRCGDWRGDRQIGQVVVAAALVELVTDDTLRSRVSDHQPAAVEGETVRERLARVEGRLLEGRCLRDGARLAAGVGQSNGGADLRLPRVVHRDPEERHGAGVVMSDGYCAWTAGTGEKEGMRGLEAQGRGA